MSPRHPRCRSYLTLQVRQTFRLFQPLACLFYSARLAVSGSAHKAPLSETAAKIFVGLVEAPGQIHVATQSAVEQKPRRQRHHPCDLLHSRYLPRVANARKRVCLASNFLCALCSTLRFTFGSLRSDNHRCIKQLLLSRPYQCKPSLPTQVASKRLCDHLEALAQCTNSSL